VSRLFEGDQIISKDARTTGVCSMAVQIPGDIVHLGIVPSAMPFFESVHFLRKALLDASRSLVTKSAPRRVTLSMMFAAQPGFSTASSIYVS